VKKSDSSTSLFLIGGKLSASSSLVHFNYKNEFEQVVDYKGDFFLLLVFIQEKSTPER